MSALTSVDALLRAEPLGAAELREGRPLSPRISGHPSDLLDRDEDAIAPGERQLEIVPVLARPAATEHPLVASDPVVDVDDDVARVQPLEDVPGNDSPQRLRPPDANRPEQLAVGDEDQAVGPTAETAVEAPTDEGDRSGRGRFGEPIDHGDLVPGLVQDVGQPGC